MWWHGDARKGKWRGNWRMEWVASTLHTTSEHGVSSITTTDAHTSTASNQLTWRPRWFKWTRQFRRKAKSGFCPCAITFKLASTTLLPTFRDNVSVPSKTNSWISWPMKIGQICCSETLVRNYHYALRNIAEERRSLFFCCFVLGFYLNNLYGTSARFF